MLRLGWVPAFFLAQLALVQWAGRSGVAPTHPDLSAPFARVGAWEAVANEPLDPAVLRQLGADETLSKTYFDKSSGASVSAFVAWFQSQQGGRQPHSPQVCLPGSGWTVESSGFLTFDSAEGPVTANRIVTTSGPSHAVVLYWYQLPRRTVAGEWGAKFWTIADAVRDHRSDTSLVRVISWSVPGGEARATTALTQFAAVFYPALKKSLPGL
jgi:EpsI family protein